MKIGNCRVTEDTSTTGTPVSGTDKVETLELRKNTNTFRSLITYGQATQPLSLQCLLVS